MGLFTPLTAPEHESLPSKRFKELPTGTPGAARLNPGVLSCVLFVLLLLAAVSLALLAAVSGPALLGDHRPDQPEPAGAVIFLACILITILTLLPPAGLMVAFLGLWQRDCKPWAALLGLGLHGSVILWWFFKWPLAWL